MLYLTNRAVTRSKEIYTAISAEYTPSLERLEELNYKLEQSKILINYWAYVESKANTPEKQNFLRIVEEDIPYIKQEIDSLAVHWEPNERDRKKVVYKNIDELDLLYDEVISFLPDFASYQDVLSSFSARDITEEGGAIYTKVADIRFDLVNLINANKEKSDEALVEMIGSFERLQNLSTYIGGFLILFGLLVGLLTSRSIVKPVHQLKGKLESMSRGVVPDIQERVSQDEIGEMSAALNNLIQGQQRIRQFVNSLGSGDFTASYEPLSTDDELAPDFIKTRDALAENERITEQKIRERTVELRQKNEQVKEQTERVTELYNDLQDSIIYAKRLQDAILPTEEQVKECLPDSFVHFMPKDIVSGDFYWTERRGDLSYVAAVDCTGHGVPGAFMSLVGHNSINMAMKDADITDSGDIMSRLNHHATNSLNRSKEGTAVRDGMDAALCLYDHSSKLLKFTGALRPLFYIREGELHQVRGDRSSIGSPENEGHRFSTREIQMQTGDVFYIFSDGYPDQFGGESKNGSKFKIRRFKEMLLRIADKPMEEQIKSIRMEMMRWQGAHAQVDDILVIGVRVA